MPKSLIRSQSFKAYADQKKSIPLSKDVRKNRINQRVGQRLIEVAKRVYPEYCKGFSWEVQLFDQPKTVNAYCMPGGKIGIYTGILPVCENEAALAAVMGHEVAHALLSHGNERVSQQMVFSGGMIAAQIGMSQNKSVNEDFKKKLLGAVGLGAQVGLLLPFSRKHESEADQMGLRLMAQAGYDPSEAANLWRRMKAKAGGKQPPELLSTHPSNQKRINRLEELKASVMPFYSSSPKYGKGEKF
jgi:predicted Zn-dependent protease